VSAAAAISPARRARHRVRTLVFERPGVYLPFARRKYPGPSPAVIGPETDLVIDGYFRSANTFAVYAFQLSQDRPVRLAHHLHAPAQLIMAARTGIPALLLLREPQGAILSELLYDDVALPDALVAYARFYSCLLPYLDSFVVGEFAQVTSDFGAVIRRLNARFSTSFGEFRHDEENARECLALMRLRARSEVLHGFESGVVTRDELRRELPALERKPRPPELRDAWVPSQQRSRAKAALAEQWLSPRLVRLRDRAQLVYEQVRKASMPPPPILSDSKGQQIGLLTTRNPKSHAGRVRWQIMRSYIRRQ
jgi:hypothetical protein